MRIPVQHTLPRCKTDTKSYTVARYGSGLRDSDSHPRGFPHARLAIPLYNKVGNA